MTNNFTTHLNPNVYNLFSKQDLTNTLSKLSDSKIITIANEINNVFNDINFEGYKGVNLTLPRIVVVGTQSSGKSTVLNSIITMDILPTGKQMTTRTPLEINMFKLEKNVQGYVEFGIYDDNGIWMREIVFEITTPIPLANEIDHIRNFIAQKTIEICGSGMNINSKPIILNIFSAFVPNLSLIDLPGLTMVACEDKGQPADIKERIENLAISYISQKQSIIVSVMQARSDLETDLGLALVKRYDKLGERTIGVITKPDLMNYDSHVGDYLLNKISKNLMLNYGYYVVKNRNDKEVMEYDILKGFKLETEYFSNHQEYKKNIYESKLGIKNLTTSLIKILTSSITEAIPTVMTDIIALDTKISLLLLKMGEELPSSKDSKLSILNRYVTNFNNKFVDSIESRGNTSFNCGKHIKDTFNKFKDTIIKIKPFHNNNYNQQYLDNIISGFEGYRMGNHTSPILVLEACIKDINFRPIMLLKEPSMQCVDNICFVLIELIRSILTTEEFSQFPPLTSCVMHNLIDKFIAKQKTITNERILKSIEDEENHIWTDDIDFFEMSNKIRKEPIIKIEMFKEFIETYFSCITKIISHNIPKIIMSDVIRFMENNTLSLLFENIVNEDKIELLKEDPNVDKQRKYYHQIKTRISNIKNAIQKNLQLEL